MRARNLSLAGCLVAVLLLALACAEPPVMPCGLSGVLGKPEFMLGYLRPNAEADFDVLREPLTCESFDRVAYGIWRYRVFSIAMTAASGDASDEQVPLRIARRMTVAWGPPDTIGVQAGVENGRAVVLEWHWKDARTLGAIRVPSRMAASGDCLLVVQRADVRPPFDTIEASCVSAIELIPELGTLGLNCPSINTTGPSE